MGKLNAAMLRYLGREDFRILTAVEMGMKNHDLVPGPLVAQLANVRSGGVHKKMMELCRNRLCCYERGKNYDGYRLTNLGYDYLALKALSSRDVLGGLGSQIGVGKESDIYVCTDPEGDSYCLKIHRLGRTSFRNIKKLRDYHSYRTKPSWIYLSHLSATKEYAFMNALHDYKFPVPRPIDFNRHMVVMELVNGYPLNQIRDLANPAELYSDLMDLIIRLANHGVIHSDFNEFNVMVDDNDKPILIDFPQMVSTEHMNAQMYFDRDVNCVYEFFKRRFDFVGEFTPDFKTDVTRECNLDKEIAASGYSKEIETFDTEFRDDGLQSDDDDDAVQEDNVTNNDHEDLDKTNEDELHQLSNEVEALCKCDDEKFVNLDKEMDDDCKDYKDGEDPYTHIENDEIPHVDAPPSPTFSKASASINKKNSRALSPSSRSVLISELASIRERRKNGELDDASSVFDFAIEFKDDGGRALSHVSGSTSASTITPEEVKRRTKGDITKSLNKQRMSKRNLRVKGEANACVRLKKDNLQEIRETVGWDEY